jgi:hypothetical protein
MNMECVYRNGECGHCSTNNKAWDSLRHYEELEEQELLLVLPCKIGTPVYYVGCIDCKDCKYGEQQTYNQGFHTSEGEPFADDCEEDCPEEIRTMPFSLSMLNDDGTLDKYWKLNKEDVKLD